MATRNVLKGVKSARNYKVRALPTHKVRNDVTAREPEKRRVFMKNDPYMYFIGKSLEEVNESIMEVLYLKPYPNSKLINDVLRKMRASVPMSLVQTFFRVAKTNGFQEAFDVISTSREAEDMRRFLLERKATGLEAYGNIPRKAKVEEILERRVQLLKYTRQELANKSTAELIEMMIRENKRMHRGMLKTDLINALMTVKRETKAFEPVPFSTEFLSKCVSSYKSASWMRSLIENKKIDVKGTVVGIALRGDNKYATDLEVGYRRSGWYRPKASWYDHVCRKGRKYEDYPIAYIVKTNKDVRLLAETRRMYDASLNMKEEKAPIGIGKAPKVTIGTLIQQYKERQRQQQRQRQPTIDAMPRFTQENIKAAAPPLELAPGLFTHLRLLIGGNATYCASCNNTMSTPAYKSVQGKRKVFFCSERCFDTYTFGRRERSRRSRR